MNIEQQSISNDHIQEFACSWTVGPEMKIKQGNRVIPITQYSFYKSVKIVNISKVKVHERETCETFPKVLPSFRQYTSSNCICCVHKFQYMEQNTIRELTQPVPLLLSVTSTCPLYLLLNRQDPLSFFSYFQWHLNKTLDKSDRFLLWGKMFI